MRNFIYLWRALKQAVPTVAEGTYIMPLQLLQALEYNFGGVPSEHFHTFCTEVFASVKEAKPLAVTTNWALPPDQYRPVLQVLCDSLARASPLEVHLRPRFKLLVDPSDNGVVPHATLKELFPHTPITHIWLSNAAEDATALGDSRAVADLIHCMETGRLAVITNGDRIHGHLFGRGGDV